MARKSHASPWSWRAPLDLERLEDRLVLDGTGPAGLPPLLNPAAFSPAGLVAPAAADQATAFDIAAFRITIPTQIGINNQHSQGRVMLYSETPRKVIGTPATVV